MEQEYKIDIKIKNNLIYQRIIKSGYKTVNEFCRATNISPTDVGRIINMKTPVVNKKGEWTYYVKKLCEIFNCDPEDIITPEQKQVVDSKKIELYADYKQINNLLPSQEKYTSLEYLEDEIDAAKTTKIILEQLDTLTPREKRILSMRFGLNGNHEHTLDETARAEDVTRERIRQIEAKALRKLRHPSRSDELEKVCDFKNE